MYRSSANKTEQVHPTDTYTVSVSMFSENHDLASSTRRCREIPSTVTVSSMMTSRRRLRRKFRLLDASEVERTKRRKEQVRTAAVIHRLRTHSGIIPVRRHNMRWDADPDCQALQRTPIMMPGSTIELPQQSIESAATNVTNPVSTDHITPGQHCMPNDSTHDAHDTASKFWASESVANSSETGVEIIDESNTNNEEWNKARSRKHSHKTLSESASSSETVRKQPNVSEGLTVIFVATKPDQKLATLSSLRLSNALEKLCPECILQIRPNERLNVVAFDVRNGQTTRTLLKCPKLCGVSVRAYQSLEGPTSIGVIKNVGAELSDPEILENLRSDGRIARTPIMMPGSTIELPQQSIESAATNVTNPVSTDHITPGQHCMPNDSTHDAHDTASKFWASESVANSSETGVEIIDESNTNNEEWNKARSLIPELAIIKSGRLDFHTSSTIAELKALELALDTLHDFQSPEKAALLTDSRAALQILTNLEDAPPIARIIAFKVESLEKKGWTIAFQWLPSHCGIDGNERADRIAAEAHELTNSTLHVPKINEARLLIARAGPNPHRLTPVVETVLNVIGDDSPTLCGIDVIIGDTENRCTERVTSPPPSSSGSSTVEDAAAQKTLASPVVQHNQRWTREAAQQYQRRAELQRDLEHENRLREGKYTNGAIQAADATLAVEDAARSFYALGEEAFREQKELNKLETT
ncbi:uncharacterized protein ISCGN_019355 [Ixodes scapularis]